MTELTYDVPSRLKTVLGKLAYYLKGIEMLPSIKSSPVRIEYDGEVFDDKGHVISRWAYEFSWRF